MISLFKHIEYLIAQYDCVIIPGWGAFIAHPLSAIVEKGIFRKPTRQITFNPSLTYNDGLLASSIVRKEVISYEEANKFISNSICVLKQQLIREGEVSFEKLGKFKLHNSIIEFRPYPNSICDCYYGLQDFQMESLNEMNQQSKFSEISVNSFFDRSRFHFNRSYIQIAASIILLLSLSIILTTPISIHNKQDYATMNVFQVANSVNPYLMEGNELKIAIPYKQNRQSNNLITANKNEQSENVSINYHENIINKEKDDINHNLKIDSSEVKNGGGHYLIVASLNTEKQALQYIKETHNEGLSLRIIGNTGKYRVYVAEGSIKKLKIIKQNLKGHDDSWIFTPVDSNNCMKI